MVAPRLLCTLGADSSAEVVEEFVGPAKGAEPHFTNAVAEINLADRAQIKHGSAAWAVLASCLLSVHFLDVWLSEGKHW